MNPINFLPSPEDDLPFPFADDCPDDAFQPFWAQPKPRQLPELHIHHNVNTSRVETQIRVQLTLSPLPEGVTKLHLQRHTIGRPKLLAKAEDRVKSPDTLELHTFLVRGSAMKDEGSRLRALEAATRQIQEPQTQESPALPTELGGEVRICERCKFRERKRASRKVRVDKGQHSWAEFEDERVVVFNDSEYKKWELPSTLGAAEGAMQVELPMRIACYCRHHQEQVGFCVIFTILDHEGNQVAQRMTNPILVTDRHKSAQRTSPSPSSCKRISMADSSGGSPWELSPGTDSQAISTEGSLGTPAIRKPKRLKTAPSGSIKDANSDIQALISLAGPSQSASLLTALTEGYESQKRVQREEKLPRIYKVVPPQCPKHGGCEVVCLGENFDRNVQISFGGNAALTTTFWNSQTVVCLVPPSNFTGLVPASIHSNSPVLPGSSPSIAFMYVDGN
ncbi:membrane-tethered transcription factor [Diplodia corticola]|uniref:Membrane-tethered transcription factor n=1 Tax=Diplodia corticola TaxID=236234 RepID=A0A1J9QUG8_9PEZI|nr:membrane-tethered transcription factor [Diplodia corticola]OJD32088.1 membrane-tethered transcription factor [Diplodia corticola]